MGAGPDPSLEKWVKGPQRRRFGIDKCLWNVLREGPKGQEEMEQKQRNECFQEPKLEGTGKRDYWEMIQSPERARDFPKWDAEVTSVVLHSVASCSLIFCRFLYSSESLIIILFVCLFPDRQ